MVIMDVHMPGMNGFETAPRLIRARPGLRVLLVTAFPSAGLQSLARQAGAVDCLSKKALNSETVLKFLCAGSRSASSSQRIENRTDLAER